MQPRSYQLLHRIGQGGMAELHLARVRDTFGGDRHCVIKRIRRDREADQRYQEMFAAEARITGTLSHPNTPVLLDCGELDGAPFIALEYIHGVTVRDLMTRARETGNQLPLGSVLAIIAGCAAGLHHAHERRDRNGVLGLVHGDVSPSNLMVGFEGAVKVIDFGVARTAELEPHARGSISGKYGYMSPEQCRNQPIDRRSDLFSLGVVMWELLTGRRLFDACDLEQMMAMTEHAAPPPSLFRPGLPPLIDAIVARLLACDPDGRFATAAGLLSAIEFVNGTSSTSALGRLVIELVGSRIEPWLACDRASDTLTIVDACELPTLVARPGRMAG